jgi:hypothetical protein
MGGAYSARERDEKCTQNIVPENQTGRAHLQEVGSDVEMVLTEIG